MKKFGIILAGCGQHDGSETHEVILTLLSMDQEGVKWEAFAPDIEQQSTINHLTEVFQPKEKRSVLTESARLVRGNIKPLTEANASEFDAFIFPGGLGAVTNLCDWKEKGTDFSFNKDVKVLIDDIVKLKKPLGFICIAPMMIPKIFNAAELTIGNDKSLAIQIQEMGSHHVNCTATEVVVDHKNRVVSTPANMVASGIGEVYIGIKKLVQELKRMS
jgi:enhancing lycopene biosynthesis protein 2